jgi:hypothetical protein
MVQFRIVNRQKLFRDQLSEGFQRVPQPVLQAVITDRDTFSNYYTAHAGRVCGSVSPAFWLRVRPKSACQQDLPLTLKA